MCKGPGVNERTLNGYNYNYRMNYIILLKEYNDRKILIIAINKVL